MKKNNIVILIIIFVTIISLIGGWFYLQYVMDNYDGNEGEDMNENAQPLDENQSSTSFHLSLKYNTFDNDIS